MVQLVLADLVVVSLSCFLPHFRREHSRKLLVEFVEFATERPPAVQVDHEEVALEDYADFLDAPVAWIRLRLPPIFEVITIFENGLQMLLNVENREFAHEKYEFGDFSREQFEIDLDGASLIIIHLRGAVGVVITIINSCSLCAKSINWLIWRS